MALPNTADALADLAEGLAAAAASAGIGTYRSDGSAYQDGETAIFIGEIAATPDRAIAVNLIPMTDSVVTRDAVIKVQFGLRGNPGDSLDTLQLAGALFQRFQDDQNTVYGLAFVEQMLRTTSAPLGQDDSERYLRSEEYDVYLEYLDAPTDPTVDVFDGGSL